MAHSPPIVLSFAASDPTGGGGMQADLLTIASLGCHPLTAITALTAQDTASLESLMPLDPDWVTEQARLVLEDMAVAAFKVGHVGSIENAAAIAAVIADYPEAAVVLDPVLASARGDELADENLISALAELLIPQATVVTLNALELRRITADDADDEPDLDECAERVLALGPEYLLVTGTHENAPEVVNSLYGPKGLVRRDRWERLPGRYHGAGSTLSAAIAATLANGLDVPEAVLEAQEYTFQSLVTAFRPGMGLLLPDRFFWAREVDADEAADS